MPTPPLSRSNSSSETDTHPALSKETFRSLLSNPTGLHAFMTFLQKENNEKSLSFYQITDKFYQDSLVKVDVGMVGKIYSNYIHEGSPQQVNIPSSVRVNVIEALKSPTALMFQPAQEHVFNIMFADNYRRFIHVLLQRKAQQELQSVEEKPNFVGLGDCFCLTDPSLPDNPIVCASDGFIKVTGYTRQDVIPHNCRFLQGDGTDKETVRRMGKNIREEKNVTELLLNYRKDGTPFWNLLYICPLKDLSGKTQFFLGGQVDVTQNINNSSPLRTILEAIDSVNRAKAASSKVQKKGFLDFLWKKKVFNWLSAESTTVDPYLDLDAQREAFMETYTNFLVFDAVDKPGAILFVSDRFTVMTGFTPEEVIAKDCSFLKGPLTSRAALKQMKSSMKNATSWSREIVTYDATQTPHLNHIFLTPILNENGKPKFLIAVMKWRQLDEEEIQEMKLRDINENEDDLDCWFQ